MKSQTERPVRRPENQRSAKPKRYHKQTARVEARRDGKTLIFGWGKNLCHNEKIKIQCRGTVSIGGLFVLLIVGTVVGFWINLNIVVPGLAITSVNGHAIPQSQYHKLVAFRTQLEVNKLYGPHGLTAQVQDLQNQDKTALDSSNTLSTQIDSLNKQIKALPSGSGQQRTNPENQLKTARKQLSDAQVKHASLSSQISNLNQNTIPLEKQPFTQSQVGNASATWLQDDELIREWLTTQSTAIQNKINPSPTQINNALNNFKANIPTSSGYNSFLSQMNISNDDVVQMMTLNLRRTNMQNYLASLTVSPAYQVLARTMTIDTLPNPKNILKHLHQEADFGQLAKQKSVDSGTASTGGSLGWLPRGVEAQSDQSVGVDNWLFDPSRVLNQISPVLVENGAFRIVQILNIDPSRPIDASTLQSLKIFALSNWLLEVKALPATKITPIDQTMLLDPNNLPPTSVLPSGAPATTPVPGAPGVPGVPGSTGGP